MAISKTHTERSQSVVQAALAQRQRNEELKRKQQEMREQEDRARAAILREHHFENQRKEQEREEQLERERIFRATELARREKEKRDALLYGPKKTKAVSSDRWPTSDSKVRDEVRRRRAPLEEDGDDAGGFSSLALTREEKRQRKQQSELLRDFASVKRLSLGKATQKNGTRLPGGALDLAASSLAIESSAGATSSQSVKARIAAIPNTLTKLNVVKRDVRTIDEILQDRAKARESKVIGGDQAREFNDWFGVSKKESSSKAPPASASASGSNTPGSQSSSSTSKCAGTAQHFVSLRPTFRSPFFCAACEIYPHEIGSFHKPNSPRRDACKSAKL